MNDLSAEHRSVLITMAHRHGMEPAAFEQTLRSTVMPQGVTREQFAAFLLVARDYNLNPVTREIHAFPRPGGGIQPIVGVDGWYKLMNSHPQMDGISFEDIMTDEGDLIGIKCSVRRKDRSHPIEVIEYMTECRRNTEPWRQWPIRMLRHKAAIQCARVAFGFSGIIDPDEFERWTDKPQPERSPRIGKREMTRQFKAWEPSGNPETWEEPKTEEPSPRTGSAAEAYELGRQARTKDASRLQWPGMWRDQAMIDAWLAGWDEEDRELKSGEGSQ